MPRKDPPRLPKSGGRVNVFDTLRTSRTPASKARRNKQRSDVPGTARLTREPKLTAEYAHEFVKLLHAGIPRDSILAYFSPKHYATLTDKERLAWLTRWANSPLMAQAAAAFNNGRWQDLDKDARLELALDKHMAELAYFLYTSSYDRVDGIAFKKVVDARSAILEYVKDGDGESDTPFMRAMRDLLAGKLTDGDGPPKIGDIGETIPAERINKISES